VNFNNIESLKFPNSIKPTNTNSSMVKQEGQISLEISPDAFVISDALLQGRIVIGPGTIVNPKAIIDAGNGQIVFGSNNIVEETAVIRNVGPNSTLKIGNDNLFEIGSVCEAQEVGDNNVFGIGSIVGPNVKVTDGCRIGIKCQVLINGILPPQSSIQFQQNKRTIALERPTGQKSQTDFLKKLMPKYSMALKNAKK